MYASPPKISAKWDYRRMSPPAEQLIRDYLNRVSVAALGRLGPPERRALLARTRESIEDEVGKSAAAPAAEVARVLAALGEPEALVDRERPLAAGGAATGPGSAADPVSMPPPTREFTVRRQPISAGRPGEPGQTGSPGQHRGLGGSADAGDQRDAPRAGRPGRGLPVLAELMAALGNAAGWSRRPGHDGGQPELPGPGAGPGGSSADRAPPGEISLAGALSGAASALGRVAAAAWVRARRHPLEACALVLLGLGGLVFPPIWLFGVLVALPSRMWDFRDKWIGLAGPVVLVILGAWLAVMLGGEQGSVGAYAHEAWMFAAYLSRAAAVLGAAYLAWRLEQGPRRPAVPPWSRHHRG